MDEIINKVVLSLDGKISDEDIAKVRNAMMTVMINYDFAPKSTEVIPYEYQLPDCYRYFMTAKKMDGKMSERSQRQYKMCIESMLYRIQLPVDQITANHLRSYILEISHKPDGTTLAASTINQRKAIIRSFFSWLTEEEYVSKNPALRLHQERVNRKPEPVFTDIQLETIQYGCKCARDQAIISLLTSSGIRITECVTLKKSDVDLENRTATILGKGGKYRTVYFDARAEFDIRRYLTSRTDDSPYLFVTRRKPYKEVAPETVRDMMAKISKATGIKGVHPHRFRHTFATNLTEKGMPLPDVQQILGHAKVDTTIRYTHVSTTHVKQAYERYA